MNITIMIACDYPYSIKASAGEEWMFIVRCAQNLDNPSDQDTCAVTSFLDGDETPQTGVITWGQAFSAIADSFSCTTLDAGFNSAAAPAAQEQEQTDD
jgi:hypothetical protein